jgi:mRNA-degrading endonuclease RelE of RelBE toxin-antitoxin system
VFLFELQWTDTARETYKLLKGSKSQQKRYKAVKKTLKFLAADPHHNSLQTHEYNSLRSTKGEKVFEAYAEQNTPAAYRVFFYYGPSKGIITILAITPHP